jgi:hypothetical protein
VSERAYLDRLSSASMTGRVISSVSEDRIVKAWRRAQAAKSRGAALEVLRIGSSVMAVGFALGAFHAAVGAIAAVVIAVIGWWSLRSSLALFDRRAVVMALPDAIMRTIPYLHNGYRPRQAWNLARFRTPTCGDAQLDHLVLDGELAGEQSHLVSAFQVTLELLADNRGTAEQVLTAFADEIRQTERLLEIACERLATSVRMLWMTTILTGGAVGIALRHLAAADKGSGFVDFITGLAAVLLVLFVLAGEFTITLFRGRLWRD